MATPNPSRAGLPSRPLASRPKLGRGLLALALLLSAVSAGWWLGQQQLRGRTDPKQALLSREASQLRQRLDRQEASDADKQRLLELLVALDRHEEAIALLEPMADREPDRWALRLMLAELRRDRGDQNGAERELRMILSRKSDQVEALQLMTLLELEQGRGAAAEARVKAALTAARKPPVKPDALGLGLLLAELQQKRELKAAAEATYTQSASDFPQDQRPLLGLALLRHDLGNIKGAQEALAQARLRSPDPSKPDPRLDKLAANWGLAPLRGPSAATLPGQAPPQAPDGAAPTGRPAP